MTAFKDKSATEFAEKSYLNRIVIYLESEEDRLIIGDRWFYDENLEFRSAGEEGQGGGCNQVIRKVTDDEEKGIKSVGLVDRDVLLKDCHWECWWEQDDTDFRACQPYGENIKVLSRWEIENYLLVEPDIIASVKADRFGRAQERPAPIPLSSEEISLFTMLTAADACCHMKKMKKVSDSMAGFTGTSQELRTSLEKKGVDSAELDEKLDKAVCFAGDENDDPVKQWRQVNRILNGKAILKRLQLLGKKQEDATDYRLALARKIADDDKIDPEIRDYIAAFRRMKP
ncbi:hypothetical protein VU01_10238 [Candidatus Electrothrix marina]|uniref:DUF4435 domain-containing protein n=1 Tax=Candidatus Electrothrix marina TaxID=1859130 RepID=A0A444JGS3_9BACT|nr:hypothetical protein VU01_10238 [Candidatus Electrothrix marina]